jgi:hypothetical protein
VDDPVPEAVPDNPTSIYDMPLSVPVPTTDILSPLASDAFQPVGNVPTEAPDIELFTMLFVRLSSIRSPFLVPPVQSNLGVVAATIYPVAQDVTVPFVPPAPLSHAGRDKAVSALK